jgi:hypothetical protein
MATKSYVACLPLTSFDTAALNATFQPINTGGLDAPCIFVRIINDSNVDVIISYDGVVANDYILTEEVVVLPYQAQADPITQFAGLRRGTTIYVKQSPGGPGVGLVYLAAYYQAEHP